MVYMWRSEDIFPEVGPLLLCCESWVELKSKGSSHMLSHLAQLFLPPLFIFDKVSLFVCCWPVSYQGSSCLCLPSCSRMVELTTVPGFTCVLGI